MRSLRRSAPPVIDVRTFSMTYLCSNFYSLSSVVNCIVPPLPALSSRIDDTEERLQRDAVGNAKREASLASALSSGGRVSYRLLELSHFKNCSFHGSMNEKNVSTEAASCDLRQIDKGEQPTDVMATDSAVDGKNGSRRGRGLGAAARVSTKTVLSFGRRLPYAAPTAPHGPRRTDRAARPRRRMTYALKTDRDSNKT
ncbi:hypothetical protein EVAR_53068_1 [Eumeta japonica]|uniref:Uncharacterized protein n=1 Tax=Eumeta variegata TaxID=151549 RepID=A0A4C1YW96_EUMVA|nr:hypothetical protein EVAR_53068_1 [Eumeta japonica]